MYKGIKVRIYPNKAQQNLIEQMIGNDRFLWNLLLERINTKINTSNKFELSKLLPGLKKEFEFLKLSDSSALVIVCFNLSYAFDAFFKGTKGYPKFHSKHKDKNSFTVKNNNNNIRINHNSIRLPKLGFIKAKWNNTTNFNTIRRACLRKTPTGKYYVGLLVDYESQELTKTNKSVGIHVGETHLSILSNYDKIPSLDVSDLEKKRKYWQHKMDRRKELAKVNGIPLEECKGYQKAKHMVAKYYELIKNRKMDYLHKLTKSLVKEYDLIVIEDIKVKSFLNKDYSNRNDHKPPNQYWCAFRTLLEYKCNMYGKELKKVNPKYTSETCSSCGYVHYDLNSNDKTWICPNCNTTHDRDINASINILNKVAWNGL